MKNFKRKSSFNDFLMKMKRKNSKMKLKNEYNIAFKLAQEMNLAKENLIAF